jgi:phenylpropionate dioxygenase-like ring-hydroxylating dioxygenase large terminal subunit
VTIESRLAHPVADLAALGDTPLAVRLLGEDYVLWRDATGQPHAAADRCPHRGTRLSLGTVVAGELQCPYHGWRFGSGGRCTAIPALPGFTPGDAHRIECLPLHEAHGLLWLVAGAAGGLPPRFPAEDDARLRKLTVGPYDVATSAPRIVENFLDMAHFGFVHAGWLGDASQAAVPDYTVTADDAGVHARGCRAWQPRSNLASTTGSWVDYDYDVPAPYTALLQKAPDAQAGWRESIALFVCPVEPEASRVWFRLAVPDFQESEASIRAFQDTIFAQDKPVLESQRPRRLPLSAGEVHCAADRTSAAYRRWLRHNGITFGVC